MPIRVVTVTQDITGYHGPLHCSALAPTAGEECQAHLPIWNLHLLSLSAASKVFIGSLCIAPQDAVHTGSTRFPALHLATPLHQSLVFQLFAEHLTLPHVENSAARRVRFHHGVLGSTSGHKLALEETSCVTTNVVGRVSVMVHPACLCGENA